MSEEEYNTPQWLQKAIKIFFGLLALVIIASIIIITRHFMTR